MRKSVFQKHLDQLDEESLREELKTLYGKIDAVRKHYAMELGSQKDRKRHFEKAKKEIQAKYATKSYRRPRRPRIQKIYKIISDVRKTSVFEFEMIDIYLFNAEEGINFMNRYRYYSAPLFNSISKTFVKALELIQSNMMHDEYKARVEKIRDDSIRDRELFNLLKTEIDKVYSE
ncbi:MAG: hypothetical protein HKN67_00740 [Saprospiraceae bacterium]|nr:hypothetical protein [Saprospiraceae bacterium]